MLMAILFLLGGFVLLVAGAEALVRGAASLALRLGVSALVVGLTIVACGTSAPEMAVSVMSALDGNSDIAVGNVVGSNIFNIAVILGLAAVICPIVCHASFIRRETPIMIAVGALIPLFAWLGARFSGMDVSGVDGLMTRGAGALLVALGVGYTWLLYWLSKRENAKVAAEFEAGVAPGETADEAKRRPVWADVLYILAGVALLVGGSKLLVDGAVTVAHHFGVSDLVIGLTIVAGGTSLPELATSVVAALRKQPDIAVGNVVGSNIFNVLFILGVTALISPVGVSHDVMVRDVPVMLAVAALSLPLMATGKKITRIEGGLLLVAYGGYLAWLLSTAKPG